MPIWRRLKIFWRNLFEKDRVEQELSEEVHAYLELLVEMKITLFLRAIRNLVGSISTKPQRVPGTNVPRPIHIETTSQSGSSLQDQPGTQKARSTFSTIFRSTPKCLRKRRWACAKTTSQSRYPNSFLATRLEQISFFRSLSAAPPPCSPSGQLLKRCLKSSNAIDQRSLRRCPQ